MKATTNLRMDIELQVWVPCPPGRDIDEFAAYLAAVQSADHQPTDIDRDGRRVRLGLKED